MDYSICSECGNKFPRMETVLERGRQVEKDWGLEDKPLCPPCRGLPAPAMSKKDALGGFSPERKAELTRGSIIKCPSGHDVKVADLHSTVKLETGIEIEDAILFSCPGGKRGHSFTLRQAVASGMFTQDQAGRISLGGLKHREQFSKHGILQRQIGFKPKGG